MSLRDGRPKEPSTWWVIKRIVTFRSNELKLSEFVGGCYLMVLWAVVPVVGIGAAAVAIWLASHLRWVS